MLVPFDLAKSQHNFDHAVLKPMMLHETTGGRITVIAITGIIKLL